MIKTMGVPSGVKMNPDVKAKWTAALRSGDYHQGKGYLCQPNSVDTFSALDGSKAAGYCCLGVLCDIAVKEGVITATETKDYDSTDTNPDKTKTVMAYGDADAYLVLPDEVKKWAGLEDCNPTLLTDATASFLNDGFSMGFRQIADIIDLVL